MDVLFEHSQFSCVPHLNPDQKPSHVVKNTHGAVIKERVKRVGSLKATQVPMQN